MSPISIIDDYEINVDKLTANLGIKVDKKYLFLEYSKEKIKYISCYVQLIWGFKNERDHTPESIIEESQKLFKHNKEHENNALWKSYCALGLRELGTDFHKIKQIIAITEEGKITCLIPYQDKTLNIISEYNTFFDLHKAINLITHLKPKESLNLLISKGLINPRLVKEISIEVLDTIFVKYLDCLYVILGGK